MSKEVKRTANRKIRELKRKVRQALGLRNTFGDRIIIEDEVLVYEGDKLMFKSKGHIVNQGLIALINFIGGDTADKCPSSLWGAVSGGTLHVGTGTGVTTGTTTALVIDEGTDADSQSGTISSPAVGTYRVAWTATWNAGSLAAIDVSELGLSLYIDGDALNAFGDNYVATGHAKTFFSRLSDSDGDFTTFTVNTAVPLTIEWRLTFTFA